MNRVTDGDLQIAVNGLWAAGAEAISVNGQRVSATTAIRTAGSAVLVDFRPLSPPYEITALGDPELLRSGVEEAETGEYLSEISTRYGIGVSWTTGEDLSVPARSLGTLREAERSERRGGGRLGPVGRTDRHDPRQRRRGRRGAGGLPVIAILGLVVGIVLGVVVQPDVPAGLQPYLPIAVVAALDTLAGGLRASLDGAFDAHVFITSFLFNVLIAALLVFLGDQLGVGPQLSTAVTVVLGIRIFSNAAAIRRLLFRS